MYVFVWLQTAGAKRVKWFCDDHQDAIGQQPVYITNITGVSFDEPLLHDSSPSNIPPIEKKFKRPSANGSRRRPSRQHLKDMANVAGSLCNNWCSSLSYLNISCYGCWSHSSFLSFFF